MNLERYTQKAQEAILSAQQIAQGNHNSTIEPIHLLLALVNQSDGVVAAISIAWRDRPPIRFLVICRRQAQNRRQMILGAQVHKHLPSRQVEVIQPHQLSDIAPLAHSLPRVLEMGRPDIRRPDVAPVVEQQVHAELVERRGRHSFRNVRGRNRTRRRACHRQKKNSQKHGPSREKSFVQYLAHTPVIIP